MNKSRFKKYGRRKAGCWGRTKGYNKIAANRAVRRGARNGHELERML